MSNGDDNTINSRLKDTPIAIVGMGSMYAEAKNLSEFWDNILNEVDCIKDVPPSRWNIDDYYDEDKSKPDKTYCKRGGFLPDIDFNPMEYGLPPNILEITDVSHLLSLVVAKETLEDAGLGADSGYDRDRMGIVLGVLGAQKLVTPLTSRLQYPVLDKVLESSGVPEADRNIIIEKMKAAYVPWEENSFPGTLSNVIAGRIANRFDLGGLNCVVDAACAGSLAAVKMAVSELLDGHSDVMLTGGVCCDNSPYMFMCFSKTPAFTTEDTIQPFDHESKGMLVGEGIGMVAMKRLADAERDGDRIYSVIKGIGASSDGRFKSIYAPRPAGQVKALQRAYTDAGFPRETIGLLEAHGTGTAAGDKAEFSAAKTAYSEHCDKTSHIAIGSVKSQIGHAKSAAGAAGLIKASLALHHKVLPATINVSQPNPELDIENSPFYINSETRPWLPRTDGIPRRAGLSSFGFGGTNLHIAMEEYTPNLQEKQRLSSVPQTIIIAANDVNALQTECRRWLDAISGDESDSQQQQLTTQCGIRAIPQPQARVGFTSRSADQTKTLLTTVCKVLKLKANDESWDLPLGIFYRRSGMDTQGKIVAMFPDGSQYINMAKELVINFPPATNAIAEMDRLFATAGKPALSETIYPQPVFDDNSRQQQAAQLNQSEYAKPATAVISAAYLNLLQNVGLNADFATGHGVGNLTAQFASGAITRGDLFEQAKVQGENSTPTPDISQFSASLESVYNDGGRVFIEFGPQNQLTQATKIALKGKEHLAIALNPNANKNSDDQLRSAVAHLIVTGVPLAELDPYEVVRPDLSQQKKPAMNIRLNAGLYQSEKSKQAFEDKLNDGHKIGATS